MLILANNHMNGKSLIATTNRGWISPEALMPYVTKRDLLSQMSNGQGSHNRGCSIQVTMCLCAHHLVQT